jgi:hypothetical protein
MKRQLLAAAFVMAGTVFSGCAAGGAFVAYGPPPPRYGIVGVAPGPGYIWTEGFWDLRGGNWVWAGGHWMRPPRPHAVWVAPAWRHEGNRWRFYRGRWQ